MGLLTREVLIDLAEAAPDWTLWGSMRQLFVASFWKRFTDIITAEEEDGAGHAILRLVLKADRDVPPGGVAIKVLDLEHNLLYDDSHWLSGIEFAWYDEITNVLVFSLRVRDGHPLAGNLLDGDSEEYVSLLVIPLYRAEGFEDEPIPGFVLIPTDYDKIGDDPYLTPGLQRRIIALLLK